MIESIWLIIVLTKFSVAEPRVDCLSHKNLEIDAKQHVNRALERRFKA